MTVAINYGELSKFLETLEESLEGLAKVNVDLLKTSLEIEESFNQIKNSNVDESLKKDAYHLSEMALSAFATTTKENTLILGKMVTALNWFGDNKENDM